MHPTLSVLTPQRIATEAFTDATAAVARLDEIYDRNTRFLRDHFEAYVNGEPLTTRVRATYPLVRMTTSTHARLDSRLSYGFVADARSSCVLTVVSDHSGLSANRAGLLNAHVWLEVRVLPAPPRSPAQTGISRFSANRPDVS
jgi:hypothetical protein